MENASFAAGDRVTVILYGRTRDAIASAAIAAGAYVDATAGGEVVAGILGAAHVALTASAAQGDLVELAETR